MLDESLLDEESLAAAAQLLQPESLLEPQLEPQLLLQPQQR
ncbi:MAG TPA: hypothetical protein VHU84_13100 [Lacipirellulaceae bacterium]|nr:hypothetical protein [Lacipirellulaceae bacterium]